MKLLLDQGLARQAVTALASSGIDSVHVGPLGLSQASDDQILSRTLSEGWVLATLDDDFHEILALSGASGPSVIRLRVEGLSPSETAFILCQVIEAVGRDLETGVVVTVTAGGIRWHPLPLSD